MAEQRNAAGFELSGKPGWAHVILTHADWPGAKWLLRIPEFGRFDVTKSPREVVWSSSDGPDLAWQWDDGEIGFSGCARAAGSDEVEYSLTYRNLGTSAWDKAASSLICLTSAEAPAFHDLEGHRTFAYECKLKQFLDIDTMQEGKWADHRMYVAKLPGLARAGDRAVERLIVKVSRDGDYVLGMATAPALGISCNHQERISCIHSNPLWGAAPPGESRTAHGKIYLFRGTPNELLERYASDFGMVSE